MERALILLTAAVLLFVTPGVKAQLTEADNTQVDITRTGCGTTKLCVETPDDCNPAGNTTCFFGSANLTRRNPPNGVDFAFELSGNSSGYIALGLTTDLSEGNTMLFICAQLNGTLQFGTRSRNNSNERISPSSRNMTDVRGVINGGKIQCEFNVAGLNASSTTTRDAHFTSFFVLLGSGTFDGTTVGAFEILLNSTLLNLADPASNIATTPATTTASAPETLHSQAVLFLLSILSVSVLQTV